MSNQQVMFFLLMFEAEAIWKMFAAGCSAQYLYDECGDIHEISCADAFLLNSIGLLEF